MNGFEILQQPQEFTELLGIYRALKPARVLEIGSLFGGTLVEWMANAPGALVVSVDKLVPESDGRHAKVIECRSRWPAVAVEYGCKLVAIEGDSTDLNTIAQVEAFQLFDFVFIDGCHDYHAVKHDYETYSQMVWPGGIVALHDVSVTDDSVYQCGRYWRDLRKTLPRYKEINVVPGQFGIGVVYA